MLVYQTFDIQKSKFLFLVSFVQGKLYAYNKYLATGFQAHGVKDFICSICVYLMNNIQFMIIKSSNFF